MCKDRRRVHRIRAAQAKALPLRVPLHAQDWQRCVRYCLNDAVGGYLYRLQIPPQMAEGLVMVAGHGGAAAYKPRQSSRGQGPMYQVALGLLMIRDPIQQVAAEIDVQCLHPPADAQNRAFPLHKGLYQLFLLSVKLFPDITAAGEQQSTAQGGVGTVGAADGYAAGKIYGGGVIAQIVTSAGNENRWNHG